MCFIEITTFVNEISMKIVYIWINAYIDNIDTSNMIFIWKSADFNINLKFVNIFIENMILLYKYAYLSII